MTRSVAELLEEALRLPEAEREELASRLMDSLEPTASEAEIEAAWGDEIRRRIEDLETGRVKPIRWEEARRMIEEGTDEFHEP